MTLIAISVLSEAGKVLLSRQFVSLSKARIDEILGAFPKLVAAQGTKGTVLEAASVRYVYQRLGELFVVLVTSVRGSNIVEDLDTLRLVAKLVPRFCEGTTAADVVLRQFELLFALDEVAALGHSEHTTLRQVCAFADMESQEEKLQDIVRVSREKEAQELMRRRAAEITQKKKELAKFERMGASAGVDPALLLGATTGTGSIGSLPSQPVVSAPPTMPVQSTQRSRGLNLASERQSDDLAQSLGAAAAGTSFQAPKPVAPEPVELPAGPLVVQLQERLSGTLERDGALKQLDVTGDLCVLVRDPDFARVQVQVAGVDLAEERGFRLMARPVLDRMAWKKRRLLQLRDNKQLPVGRKPVQLVRWRRSSSDCSPPVSVLVWPGDEGSGSSLTVEFTTEESSFDELRIEIPLPRCRSQNDMEVSMCDAGDAKFDLARRSVVWTVPQVEANAQGMLELKLPRHDSEMFHPVHVSLSANTTLSGILCAQVTDENGGDVDCQVVTRLVTESLQMP